MTYYTKEKLQNTPITTILFAVHIPKDAQDKKTPLKAKHEPPGACLDRDPLKNR